MQFLSLEEISVRLFGAPHVCGDLTLAGACGNGARNRRGARMIHWILEQGLQVLNRLHSTMATEES